MTKARVRVAATAIAKMSSGGEEPAITSFLTSIGCARRRIRGWATPRFSRAREEKRITRSSESRWAPGGIAGRSASRIAPVAFSPSISIALPSTSNSPPSISRLRYLPPSAATLLAITRLACASRALILSSTVCALSGFSSLTRTSTFGVPGESVESELISLIRLGGRTSAASASPDSTSCTASARFFTLTHSTCSQIRALTPIEGSCRSPTVTRVPGGTSLRKATRGLLESGEIAKPTRIAISTG